MSSKGKEKSNGGPKLRQTSARQARNSGASPDLTKNNKKRGRDSEDMAEQGPPSGKRPATDPIMEAIKSLTDKVDARFDRVSTKQDMEKILDHVNANSNEIAAVKRRQAQYRANFKADVEKVVDSRLAEVRACHTGLTTLTPEEAERENQYKKARRSMRVWPLPTCSADITHVQAFRDFCETTLKIPKERAQKLGVEEIFLVDPSRRTKIQNEAVVRL